MSEQTAAYEISPAADRVESLALLDRKTAALVYDFAGGIVDAAKRLDQAQEHAIAVHKSAQQAFPTLSSEWLTDLLFIDNTETAASTRIRMANQLADQLLAAIKDDRATRED